MCTSAIMASQSAQASGLHVRGYSICELVPVVFIGDTRVSARPLVAGVIQGCLPT